MIVWAYNDKNGYQYSAKLDEDRTHAKEQVEEENKKEITSKLMKTR